MLNLYPGLIHYRIVIHAFVDGFSRLVTGIRASDNNRADTVADLFHSARQAHGTPSRVRGDHGVENLDVAAFMESTYGVERGSYIWGRYVKFISISQAIANISYNFVRSVHNIRIERLWRDVTRGFGLKWKNFFVDLEAEAGLQPDNDAHIWLLHYLFLQAVNNDAAEWAEVWNSHNVRIQGERERSPRDMFFFGQLENGWRDMEGDHITPYEEVAMEDLVGYGVDWNELEDCDILQHHHTHNFPSTMEPLTEPHQPFGRSNQPPHMSLVEVPSFDSPFTDDELDALNEHLIQLPQVNSRRMGDRKAIWMQALAFCRALWSS